MRYFGPSTLVSAAFIGPGTITVCTLAGVNHGYDLLFAVLFSGIATIVLQEMAARVGLITQAGLGKIVSHKKSESKIGFVLFLLVAAAIILGNMAYEAGNISGAGMGVSLINAKLAYTPIIVGLIAIILLYWGSYKQIEGFLIGMVICMSLAFLVTIIFLKPSPLAILQGFIPHFNKDTDWKNIASLVGTTVVPYNLFLQSSLIARKYNNSHELRDLRIENFISISLGVLVSIMIIVVAASQKGSSITSPSDLAVQLKPLLGKWAEIGSGIGLFAAGLSSAITAPLAAALLAKELFQWPEDDKFWKYRATWLLIIVVGILFSTLKINVIALIQTAQLLNGILLPIIAIYLVYTVNQKELLGNYVNSKWQNILAAFVVSICLLISLKTLFQLFIY